MFRFLCEMYQNDSVCPIGPEQFALLATDPKAWQRFLNHSSGCERYLIPIWEQDCGSANLAWSLVLADVKEMRCVLFDDERSLRWSQLPQLLKMFSTFGTLHVECLPYEHVFDDYASLQDRFESHGRLHDGITILACAYQIVTGASHGQSCVWITKNKLKELIHNFEIE